MALPYFAILNSKIGKGQTLGKRWMHLQVVNKNGETISLGKSVVRYAVFAVPYYLDAMVLPTTRTPWIVSTLLSIIIYGVGVCTLYLILFNRHTRQGVHDLAADSYVADGDKTGPLKVQTIWKAHWVILVTLLITTALGTKIFGDKLAKWGPFPELLEDVRLVEAMDGVQAAGAQDLTSNSGDGGKEEKSLVIDVFWTGESGREQAFANRVAKVIIQHDPKLENRDSLKIVIKRGYDLGIAHAEVSHYYEHSPAEWQARLFGSSPVGAQDPNKL